MIVSSLDAARDYQHVYIAPHLDDAALSCGGQIAQHVAAGDRVVVVTLCAGTPPAEAALSPFAQYLHSAWALGDDPIAQRRQEDATALAILGCDGVHLGCLDAPYRMPQYGSGDGWRGPVAPDDPLVSAAAAILARLHTQQPQARWYVPLGVGNHVDHQVVCAAGLDLHTRGAHVQWYEDAPYAAKSPTAIGERRHALAVPFAPSIIDIAARMRRKLQAIYAYRSQLQELFGDHDPAQVMTRYAAFVGQGTYAERLWQRL